MYLPEGLDNEPSVNVFPSFASDVLQVRQEGCLVGDGLEIVDRELYFSGPGHRKQVQNLVPMSAQHTCERDDDAYGVGRTSDDIDDGNSIEEGPASNDIPESADIDSHATGKQESNKLWLEIKLHQNFQVFRCFQTLLGFLCGEVNLCLSWKVRIGLPG